MPEATATLHLAATYDPKNPGTPQGYAFTVSTVTFQDAQDFVARFPKSCKLVACELGGDPRHRGYVRVSGDLLPDGTRGERNETAIKRYRSIVRACERLGVAIDYRIKWSNSYPTREAFEAAIDA